jgi:hypothetical protein
MVVGFTNICAINYKKQEGWVFNATFNDISAISWRSVSLAEETGEPGEKLQLAVSH